MTLDPRIEILCHAGEEYAESLDDKAEQLSGMGQEGRRAARIVREEAAEVREAVASFRPLRVPEEAQ